MLDSVRMLQQQLTLKDLVIQAFVPPEDVQKVTVTTVCMASQARGVAVYFVHLQQQLMGNMSSRPLLLRKVYRM